MDLDKLIKELLTDDKYVEYEKREKEHIALTKLTDSAKALRESLNDNQLPLFIDYLFAVMECKSAAEQRALLTGVRLAAEYFTKKSEDD